jgi:transaldolase
MIKIFADGADKTTILKLYENSAIAGFTTNPTLMRAAGIKDYEAFAKDVLAAVPDRPISFEVIADDFDEMSRQAFKIADWGSNVYVKIPVTNTRGSESFDLIRNLSHEGIKVNVTAVMTQRQITKACLALSGGAPAYISVFAGRIADTGRDPIPDMTLAVKMLEFYPNIELIWASPREVLNVYQAESIGCDIITVTPDILKKLPLVGKSLWDYSLETVQMFFNDAKASGFTL